MLASSVDMGATFSGIFAVLVLVSGVLAACKPWLTPKTEIFSVTVPLQAFGDARIKRIRIIYAAVVILLTIICAAVVAFDTSDIFAFVVSTFAILGVSFGGMLVSRQRVREIKELRKWSTADTKISAVILPAGAPSPIPVKWNLLYIPIIMVTIVLTYVLYPSMPDPIPTHFNFNNQPNGWMEKSVISASLAVLTEIFIAVVMCIVSVAITRSRRPVSNGHPVATSLAYGRFSQLWSILILGGGLTLTASMGLLVFVMAGLLDVGAYIVIVLIATIGMLIVYSLVSVWCGQSGTRLIKHTNARPAMHADDDVSKQAVGVSDDLTLPQDEDQFWKAGIFYVNREDPSIFVSKRFGIGWTMNMGNWRSWAITLGLIAIPVLFIAIPLALWG